MPKLTWTVAGERKTVDVTDSCSIGKLPENTVSLPDEAGASRRHAQILKIRDGVFELSDLGSTNGTKVNGQTVKRHKMAPGDKIQIGATVVEWGGDGAPAGEEEILLEDHSGAAPAKSAGGAAGTSEQCYLVFAGGAKDGQKLTLDKKRTTFGRTAKNTHQLEDTGVSGYHCEISREGGAYVLRDLGSTNGTLVDGEPVTETALVHGARIRIGPVRLVFVDPTVSDFEKAMASVDDLGSEWGLLRAEMDLERVQRARRGQVIAIVFVLALLGGAGYVALAHPEIISGRPDAVKELAGNLVPDFSFENGDPAASFSADPETGAIGRLGDKADGKPFQGDKYYVVSREGTGARGASAAGKGTVRVDASSAYAFGGQVRGKSGGAGVVRVVWLGSDNQEVGRSATDVTSGADWKEVRRTIAHPPKSAVLARIELVDQGAGAAHFDDLFLGRTNAPAKNDAADGSVVWDVTGDGQASLTRGDVTIFSGATVVAGIFNQAAVEDESRRPDRIGSQIVTGGSGGGMKGEVWDAAKSATAPFDVSAKIEGGRYAVVTGALPEGAALVVPLAPGEEGIGVRNATGYIRVADKRIVEKVQALTVGERERWEILAQGEGSFRLAFIRIKVNGKETWAAALGGEGGKLAVRVDTDSQAIGERIQQLDRDATEALQRRRLGVALKLYRELSGKLPSGSVPADQATQTADKVEKEGRERLARLLAAADSAEQFHDDAALEEVSAEAKAVATTYAEHDIGEQAKARAAKIGAAQDARRTSVFERRAVPFLRRADDLAARGQTTVAVAIYRGVESAYPGTEAANKARTARERLSSK